MPQSERGIWGDAGGGPNCERAVVVIDSHHRRLVYGLIPWGMNPDQFAEALWVFLDTVDPSATVATHPPRRRLLARQRRGVPLPHGWKVLRS